MTTAAAAAPGPSRVRWAVQGLVAPVAPRTLVAVVHVVVALVGSGPRALAPDGVEVASPSRGRGPSGYAPAGGRGEDGTVTRRAAC